MDCISYVRTFSSTLDKEALIAESEDSSVSSAGCSQLVFVPKTVEIEQMKQKVLKFFNTLISDETKDLDLPVCSICSIYKDMYEYLFYI